MEDTSIVMPTEEPVKAGVTEPPDANAHEEAAPVAKKSKKKADVADDKKAPKKPRKTSAYDLFRSEFAKNAKAEGTTMAMSEMSQKCAAAWAELEDKTEWNEKAASANAARGVTEEKPKPKRPPTAWLNFLQEYRATHKDKGYSVPEFAKHAGAEWGTMSDDAKAKYKTPEPIAA